MEVSSTVLRGPIETLVALADTWIREIESQADTRARRTALMNLKRLNLCRGRELAAPLRERILETRQFSDVRVLGMYYKSSECVTHFDGAPDCAQVSRPETRPPAV